MLSTLRVRITATCVVLVVLALLCSSGVAYLVTLHNGKAALRQNLASMTRSSAQGIDEWVKSRSLLLHAFDADSFAVEPLHALRQLETSGGFVLAYIGYPDGRSVFTHDIGLPSNYDPTTRPWYKTASSSGDLLIATPYIDIATKKLTLTIARPVYVRKMLAGVVAVDVNLDDVNAMVKAIQPSPNSFAFIVDGEGNIIAHPNSTLDLKSATVLSPSLSAEALAAMSSASEPVEIKLSDRVKLLHAQAINGTNWKLVVALDKGDATAGERDILKGILVS